MKKIITIILILLLIFLSGCGKENINPTSNLSVGDSSLSEFVSDNYETVQTSSEVITSSEAFQIENSSNITTSFVSDKIEKPSSMSDLFSQTSNAQTSSAQLSSTQSSSALAPSQKPSSAPSSSALASSEKTSSSQNSSETILKPNKKRFSAIWISYYEFPFENKNEAEAKKAVSNMMEKIAKQGYTAVFCHVRANADAFYPSKYFPYAKQLTGIAGKNPGYDPLEVMIWASKKYGLEFHAWINPYRVSNTTTNPNELADGHIAAKWLADGSNRAVVHEKGIYFNPASTDVQKLVLNGIREILDKYNVDGIHFDDYFYPSGITAQFDSKQYNEYLQNTEIPLSLDDWRRANVNALVSSAYRICHAQKTIFGISPAGNMSLDNSHDNYKVLYADVALWMSQEGYVDYILPQLYFGYNHPVEKARYKTLLDIWCALPKHKNLKFYVGLGAYKMNENCDDKEEWHNETDLLARQVTDAVKSGADGIAVFSYEASTLENSHNALQIKNMFEAIDKLF